VRSGPVSFFALRLVERSPEADKLTHLAVSGQPGYGRSGLIRTPRAEAIVKAVERPDVRPLWVSIRHGAGTPTYFR
jgi:hypothetical protein